MNSFCAMETARTSEGSGAAPIRTSIVYGHTDGLNLDGNGDGVPGDPYLLVGDETNRFYKMAGDTSGDGGVSVFDFPSYAYWFGRPTEVAPSYMDNNHDGGISIMDFGLFARNFGRHVTAQGAADAWAEHLSFRVASEAPDVPKDEVMDQTQAAHGAATDQAMQSLLSEWNQVLWRSATQPQSPERRTDGVGGRNREGGLADLVE